LQRLHINISQSTLNTLHYLCASYRIPMSSPRQRKEQIKSSHFPPSTACKKTRFFGNRVSRWTQKTTISVATTPSNITFDKASQRQSPSKIDTSRRLNNHRSLTTKPRNHAATNNRISPSPLRYPRLPAPISLSNLDGIPLHFLHDRCWFEHTSSHRHRSRAMGLLTLRRWLVLVRYYHCLPSQVLQSLAQQELEGWEQP